MTAPLAALTTIFTPPCSITWLLTTTKVPSQFPPFPTQAPGNCDPPSWDEYLAQRGFNYYSPAVCPSGFYVGPSCVVTAPRTGEGFPAVQDGETAAYCIPNGHVCTSDVTDFRGGVWGVSRTDTATGAQVTVGPAIQIRWRTEDLESLETNPLSPGPRVASETILPYPLSTPISLPTETSTYQSITIPDATGPPPLSTTYSTETTDYPKSFPSYSILPIPPQSSSSLPPISSDLSSQATSTSRSPATKTGPGPGQGQGPGQREGDGDGNSSRPSANLTIATAILISIIAIYSIYAIVRRYRHYRAGDAKEPLGARDFLPSFFFFSLKSLKRLFLSLLRLCFYRRGTTTTATTEDEKPAGRRKLPDAELGIDGPVPELGSTFARGTSENPAELPTMERVSWKMRVSRMLLIRARGPSSLGP
ncbi:hypothetical protein F5X97DRAFT_346503 [Nemania serpens]|nr:hypothetical protein F5X97DRAFT_346503 [Nemania serpens]